VKPTREFTLRRPRSPRLRRVFNAQVSLEPAPPTVVAMLVAAMQNATDACDFILGRTCLCVLRH
jgi:hypothetical protein